MKPVPISLITYSLGFLQVELNIYVKRSVPSDAEIIRWCEQRIKTLKLKRLLAGSNSRIYWAPTTDRDFVGFITDKDPSTMGPYHDSTEPDPTHH